MTVLFVTGIDTDIGKTYATGYLAKLLQQNKPDNPSTVITQKLVQTGCTGIADDLLKHRRMMELPLQKVDTNITTCPYVFAVPASPHLASKLEGRIIDVDKITEATQILLATYDTVLLEGAGGLMVPITDDLLIIDYIAEQGYPVVLVTSGRLGSINHTLLSLEALKQRNIPLHTLVYNHWQGGDMTEPEYKNASGESHLTTLKQASVDEQIANDTRLFLQRQLATHYPKSKWLDLPSLKMSDN